MKNLLPRNKQAWMLAAALLASPPALHAALTDIADAPPAATASLLKPNIMFLLDDSGSMAADHMPDQVNDPTSCKVCKSGTCDVAGTACARGDTSYYATPFNTLYYNPQITYTPGVNSLGASLGNATPTAAKSDPYTSSSTTNLTTSFTETVWCDLPSRSGASLLNPAMCKRNGIHTTIPFAYSTAEPAPISAPSSGGYPTNGFSNAKTLLTNPHYFEITPREHCSDDTMRVCTLSPTPVAGFTVPAPVRWCNSTLNAATYPGPVTGGSPALCQSNASSTYKFARLGNIKRTNIVPPTTTTYPKVSSRTDCSGAVGPTGCSYTEELQNFANWYSYYRTRMLAMKTASGRAFSALDTRYRVGFVTINVATDTSRYMKIDTFDSAHKSIWYSKFYAATPLSGTPLREALSRVGRHYAGVTSGINSMMPDDPVQYSCQKNFALLTTDGYWNNNAGVKIDGTAILNQDNVDSGFSTRAVGAYDGNISGSTDTLADVAMYYYKTDLRTTGPVSANNVLTTVKDPAAHQHMVTFTLGLGVDGLVTYQPDYETATTGDFVKIKNGAPGCSWTAGVCDWPVPASGTPTALDDLWHAAVNGRGTFFSAKDPVSLISGLTGALFNINQQSSAVAAPATSNPNIVPGDNFLFTSTFTTLEWVSEIKRRQIDPVTGVISSTIDWSAQAQLDAKTGASSDTRTIYSFDGSTGNKLKNFLWANLNATEQGYFNGTSGGRTFLTQWSAALSVPQKNACDNPGGTACGQKLVNYLRGQRGFETPDSSNSLVTPNTGTNSLFRHRTHVLGDTVNAEAVYVRQPVFDYFDQGYSTFQTAQASRPGTVYVAANDGMLHALDSGTGAERWAYIPTMVMPNMWKLANFDYANNHRYYVDGTPTTGDICTSNCSSASATWATILVGGLNAGGRGFYALNITDPLNPKALWELKSSATCIPSFNNVPADPVPANTFSDCDIGLSFGNPIITKRAGGKWVVLVTSGYNNVSPGTGGGFLYVLDAVTGAILNKIATLIPNPPGFSPSQINAGNTTTPSGFAMINAFAAATKNDNTTLRVYGGDLNGNLWRIDSFITPNTLATSGNRALLLAILGTANALNTQGNGTANTGSEQTVGSQSVTTKPELGEILVSGVGTFEMVYVGTGRYLGINDPGFVGLQSFYGIKDPLGTFSGYGVVHNGLPGSSNNMVQQTVTEVPPVAPSTVPERHVTANTVNYTSKNGWFIDFNPGTAPGVSPGERSNTDPSLDLGILSFTTNAPNSNACDAGGKSYIYFLDYTTGGPLPANLASGLGGLFLDNSLASRVVVIRVGDKVIGITVVGSQPDTPKETTLGPASASGGGKRIYWRELNF